MLQFLIYLLQVCAWFIPLYFLYLLLYKKFTFFNWNRYYLLIAAFLSFIFPFVHINIVQFKEVWVSNNLPSNLKNTFNETTLPSLQTAVHNVVQQSASILTFGNFLFLIYMIGALFTIGKLMYNLFAIKKLIKNAQKNWTTNLAVVHTTDKVPHSSFFHYIFINNKSNNGADIDKIIYHEMQHNEKLHSVDVLFCEILKIVLWFNPFVYWYKKSLQEIHEFEVDSEMTKLYNEVSYAELLLKIATNNNYVLVNNFSAKPIKTRINMIFNPKTYPIKKFAFLLVIPVISILLMAYGNIQQKTITTIKTTNEPITIVIDAGHGGKDQGAVNGDYNESTIALQISKIVASKAKAAGYNVITTRNTDSFITLKDRVASASQNNANLFLSLHLNATKNKNANGIGCYIGKNLNAEIAEKSKMFSNILLQKLSDVKNIFTDTTIKERQVSIFVLSNAVTPAALIELGYITNDNDLKFITNTTNQEIIASKIVEGITNFITLKNK